GEGGRCPQRLERARAAFLAYERRDAARPRLHLRVDHVARVPGRDQEGAVARSEVDPGEVARLLRRVLGQVEQDVNGDRLGAQAVETLDYLGVQRARVGPLEVEVLDRRVVDPDDHDVRRRLLVAADGEAGVDAVVL